EAEPWVPALAEPVMGPRFARTRWLGRDDTEFVWLEVDRRLGDDLARCDARAPGGEVLRFAKGRYEPFRVHMRDQPQVLRQRRMHVPALELRAPGIDQAAASGTAGDMAGEQEGDAGLTLPALDELARDADIAGAAM